MIVVTIPAHNEEKTVGQVVFAVRKALVEYPSAVVVTCNCCEDNTRLAARGAGAITQDAPEPGLASVFRAEMKAALEYSPRMIVHIDADGQYLASEIPQLLTWLVRGYDMVLGNRLHNRPTGMPADKFALNRLGSLAYSTLLQKWIPDMTTGFRAFTPSVARLGMELTSQFTYTQELTWRAVKAKMHIKSIPVTFLPRQEGSSRLMKNSEQYLHRSWSDFRRFSQ